MLDVEKLTDEEIEDMVAEMRADDDGTGWVVPDRPIEYRVSMMPQLYIDLRNRAEELGMTRDEFITDAIERSLATA